MKPATQFFLLIFLLALALPMAFSCIDDDDDDDDGVSQECEQICDAIVECGLADEVGVATMGECYDACAGRWEECISISTCDELAECLAIAGDDDDDDNADDDDNTTDDDDDDITDDDDDDTGDDDDTADDDAVDDDAVDDDTADDDTADDDTADDDAVDDDTADDDTGDDDTTVPDTAWTFIVYMAGDNNLHQYALDDLDEMKAVSSSANVNILVVFDGANSGDSRIYKVNHNSLQTLNTPGELNMGDPATVRTYVGGLLNSFPAQRTALIFWNHGSGWHDEGEAAVPFKDICQDGSDWLTNTELDSALSYLRSNTPVGKFEILGFDACLMQMIEIAYYLKDDANYMIGSEETEGAQGWDYTASLQYLVNNPNMTTTLFGQKIIDSYVAYPDATLSLLKMNQIANLALKVDALADLLNNIGGVGNSNVVSAYNNTLYFSDYDYIDLYHFAHNIQQENISSAINTAASNLKSAVNTAVAYYAYGEYGYADAHGVSIYFPDPYWSTYDTAYGNLAFAQDTSWDNVIH